MKATLFLFLLITHFATAQSVKKLETGEIREINSAILHESRTLNIYLPEGFSQDSTYPVIYLLDGALNEDFPHITGIVQFLTMIQKMPPSIVVGIANVDRKRDFTFPTTIAADKKDFPTTGGSSKFMAFLELELQPFIKKTYKTKNTSTIIGQSFGALLATEVLLKKPALFSNYVIISPSLWWDNGSLIKGAKKLSRPGTKVFISVGTEGKEMEEPAKQLADALQDVIFVPLPEEDHLTILHNAVYKALIKLNPA